jgi:hypothetical protein
VDGLGLLHRAGLLLIGAVLLNPPLVRGQGTPPTLDAILAAGGTYTSEFTRTFSAVVSEETYTQRLIGAIAPRGGERRVLKSDLLLMQIRDAGWVTFRDVFEVDGRGVRDRSDRLVSLILKPPADAGEQVRLIAEDGARFNLGPISRTINTPLIGLMFLHPEAQPRSRFRLARMTRVDGQPAAEVEFTEQATPRMIATLDNAAAKGKLLLDPATGRVLRTELNLASVGNIVKVVVTYKAQERVAVLVPATMEEQYELGGVSEIDSTRYVTTGSRIEGFAAYTNFRMFTVDTSTIIKK